MYRLVQNLHSTVIRRQYNAVEPKRKKNNYLPIHGDLFFLKVHINYEAKYI